MTRPARHRPRSDVSPRQELTARIGARLAHPPSSKAATLALILIVAAGFGAGLGYPLVFGDFALLEAGRLAAYGRSMPLPGTTWLAEASFGWTTRLFGVDWAWQRTLNLALHAGTVLLAFALARRLLRDAGGGKVHSDWLALLGAALFALHPMAVYATAYLAVRSVLLHGLFLLLAVWAVFAAAGSSRRGVWWLVPVACVGALLSSPAAVVLPLVLLLALRADGKATHPRAIRGAVHGAALLVVGTLAWWLLSGGVTSADVPASGVMQSIADNAVRWLRGVGYAVAPVTAWMAIDMPEPSPVAAAWVGGLVAAAALGAYLLCVRFVGRSPLRVPVFCCGCIAAFGIASSFWPRAWASFAVWNLYPVLPFACLAAIGCLAGMRSLHASGAGLAAFGVVAVLGVLTLQTFSSHVAVWDDAIRVAERSGPQAYDARLYVNRGTLHRAQGHTLAAVADYGKALELHPDLPRALRGRAQAYIDDRRYGEALVDLRRLLEVEPGQTVTHADIGLVLMQTGDPAAALRSFQAAIDHGVREPRVYLNRGLAIFRLGGVGAAPRALIDIEQALALDPRYALAHLNRGLLFDEAARAGVRLRDAPSSDIMRVIAAQNIARACRLGHAPACELEKARTEEKAGAPSASSGSVVVTPEMLRERGLPTAR